MILFVIAIVILSSIFILFHMIAHRNRFSIVLMCFNCLAMNLIIILALTISNFSTFSTEMIMASILTHFTSMLMLLHSNKTLT